MKKKALFLFLFFWLFGSLIPETNPWGELKKIYFYDSLNKYTRVMESLNDVDIHRIKRSDKKEFARQFIQMGDKYFNENRMDLSENFYQRALAISPDYWFVYNRLEKINRERGKFFFNVKNLFKQFSTILSDFEASFILFNHFFNVLFFSSILIFFILAILLFVKYFKLSGNDLFIDQSNSLSWKMVFLVALLLLWPLLFFSGWMVYPFLVVGFLWRYLGDSERKSIVFGIIIIGVTSLLFAFNKVILDHYKTDGFNDVKKVFGGELVEKMEYEKYDNELKVYLSLSYYENNRLKMAEDILKSTGEGYRNKLKYILLGNIYYKFENIAESIKYFRMALKLDDRNDIALNNFSLVLLENDNPEVFKSWSKRYPEINGYKNSNLVLKDIDVSQMFLWRRLLNLNGQDFNLWIFTAGILKSLFTLPISYCLLIFFGYVVLMPRIFSRLGKSTYCSKCKKIIKESSVHRSYKLCNDCYQLFMIKDVIFLEAKILKEKELSRKSRKRNFFVLLASLVIPGLRLNFTSQNRLFVVLAGLFYFFLGYTILNKLVFEKVFLSPPIFLNIVGGVAVFLYFLTNLYTLRGSENGI